MEVFCPYDPRKSKPILKSELRKQQYTVTLFDCNHLAEVIVRENAKNLVLLCGFCFVLIYFEFEGNFRVQVPGSLYLEGQFIGGFFTLRILGGLYLEGLIYGGAYFRNITVT